MHNTTQQDWEQVTISKTRPGGRISSKEQDVNLARRRGQEVVTQKKFTGGRNVGAHAPPANAARIEADDLNTKLPRVTASFAQALQKARQEKKMTQSDLAKAINEKPSVVNDYEAGRAIPNGQIVSKMQRILGAKLPRAAEKPKAAGED